MKRLVLILAVFALLAAACNGSTAIDTVSTDGDATQTQPTAVTQQSDPPQDDEPPATAVPQADEPPPTEVPAPEEPANTIDFLGSDDWCTASRTIDERFDELDVIDFGNPEVLERTYTEMLQVMSQAQQIAPPQIAGDVSAALLGFGELSAALAAVNWSFLDLDLSVIDGLDEQLSTAGFNIEKYNFEVCGIGEDPGDAPVPGDDGSADDIPTEGTIRDQAVTGLVESGFTQQEAECLLDRIDFTDPGAFTDTQQLLDVFTECGISLDRLAQLGG